MSQQRGFTLLEMMLVLALIAVAASVVVFSYARKDAARIRAHDVATRLTVSLESAVDRATLSGQPMGIHFSDTDWQLMLPTKKQTVWRWVPLTEDVANQWGNEVAIQTQPFQTDDGDKPQVMILSDGQITPFSLLIKESETGRPLLTLMCSGTLPLHPIEEEKSEP